MDENTIIVYIPALFLVLAGGIIAYILNAQRKQLDVSKPPDALRDKQMRLVIRFILLGDLILAPLTIFLLKVSLGQP